MIPKTCPFGNKEKLWSILHNSCQGYRKGWAALKNLSSWPNGHCNGCAFLANIEDAGIFYAPYYIPIQIMKVKNDS
jgi:hypothetical protein